MSNSSSLRFVAALLFAATVCATLAFAEAGIRAQNTNSSTTTDDSAQNANANTNTTRRGRGRRGRRGAAANANAADSNANTGDATTNATGDDANTRGGTGAGTGAEQGEETTRDLSGQQEDLSGNYTGRLTMTGAHEMSGEATLTITGNQFTLTSEGMTHNGRVLAVNTRGYIGAAFYFADMTDPATKTPVVANVRARKSGERLTLTPVTPTSARLTFTPAGAGRRGVRPRRGTTPTPDANSNTGDNSNTTPPR